MLTYEHSLIFVCCVLCAAILSVRKDVIMSFWRKRVKQLVLAGLVVTIGAFLGGCGQQGSTTSDSKMKVVTTVYPAYDLAKQVGGDKVDVTMLVPAGSEPHDWEPTAQNLKEIGKAKVFIYNGAGLEPTEKILQSDILKKAQPLELAKNINLLKIADEEHEHEHDQATTPSGEATDKASQNKQAGKEEHHHGEYDPHIWLDPENVMKETDAVVKAFSEADPANKAYYEANGKAYKEKLAALDKDYKDFAATVTDKNLIVSHEAFGYLAKRYGFTQVGIMGIAPDAEPTPERMSEIVSFVKQNHVKAIFSEELVNPKLADAIAKETGVQVAVLSPVESLSEEQMKNGDNYLTIMRKNLETLKKYL